MESDEVELIEGHFADEPAAEAEPIVIMNTMTTNTPVKFLRVRDEWINLGNITHIAPSAQDPVDEIERDEKRVMCIHFLDGSTMELPMSARQFRDLGMQLGRE